MTVNFPFPFAGCTHAIRLTGLRTNMVISIICGTPKKDGGCGHKHNFAVDSANKTVYVSALAAECISRVLDERRGARHRA